MSVIDGGYQHPEYLVETEWLENNLSNKTLRIIECSVNVEPNSDSELALMYPFIFRSCIDNFEQSHIPNSGYIDVANELSDLSSDIPLTMPSEQQFVKIMSEFGISNDTQVILYSRTEQNWATRLWWLLRVYGFNNASVLNGGWTKWLKEQRSVSNQACNYQAAEFIAQKNPDFFVAKDEVLSAIENEKTCVINALPSIVYSGKSDIYFGRKGRIANSVNVPFTELYDAETGTYLSENKLHELFDSVEAGKAERLITYCGGGIAASNDAFVLALIGYDNVAIYDGSMLEWGNDPSLPMDVG